HRGFVVEHVLEHLIAETEVEGAVRKRQPIVGGVDAIEPRGDFRRRLFLYMPVLIEIAIPVFQHVDAVGVVALRQQDANRGANAAAEIENLCAGSELHSEMRRGKPQMPLAACACSATYALGIFSRAGSSAA